MGNVPTTGRRATLDRGGDLDRTQKSFLKERLLSSQRRPEGPTPFLVPRHHDEVKSKMQRARSQSSVGWGLTRAVKAAGAAQPVPRQHRGTRGATERLDGPGSCRQHHGGGSPPGLPGCAVLRAVLPRSEGVECSGDRRGHFLVGEWDTGCSSPFRSDASEGTPRTRVPVIPSRLSHGVLRPPTRRDQSRARPRRRTGDHDFQRSRVWWCPDRVTLPARSPSSGWCRLGGRSSRG